MTKLGYTEQKHFKMGVNHEVNGIVFIGRVVKSI